MLLTFGLSSGERRGGRTRDNRVAQGVGPVESVDDLGLDVWASDAELDALLADVRHSRQSDLA